MNSADAGRLGYDRAALCRQPLIAFLLAAVAISVPSALELCLVAMAPSAILVPLLQKFVVQGLAASAVKG